jgi:hypothetical protein
VPAYLQKANKYKPILHSASFLGGVVFAAKPVTEASYTINANFNHSILNQTIETHPDFFVDSLPVLCTAVRGANKISAIG